MNTPKKPVSKRKIGCGICLALLFILLYAGYMKCLRTTKRVFTRDNTALEKLPEGEAIPLMPDGRRVDYIRAYDLLYPDCRPDREDNAMRDVVRFMGQGIFLWQSSYSHDGAAATVDEAMAQFETYEETQRYWRAYCRRLGLEPEELTPYPGVLRNLPPDGIIAKRKYAQWKELNPDEDDDDDAAEDDMADYPVDELPDDPPEPEPAPLYDVPAAALEFPLPADLLAELAEDEYRDAESAFAAYYDSLNGRFTRPWSAAEFPEMAQWLEYHAGMLDAIAAAARQDVFLIPFYRSDDNKPLLYTLLYDTQFLQQISRMYGYRARMHITDGNAAAALADTETVWRLGRHQAHQPHCLVVHLVGLAIQQVASSLTRDLLAANICTPEQLRGMLAMLDALPATLARDDLMTVEHFTGQEYIDLIPIRGVKALRGLAGDNIPSVPTMIDPNYFADRYAVLRKTFNALIHAGEYDKAEEHVMETSKNIREKLYMVLGVRGRSELCADLVYTLMCPAMVSVFEARDRAQRSEQLTRLAIALKLYKSDHGAYPDTLGALVPAYLPALPVLPDTEKFPLTYRRKDAGFILSAVDSDYDPETGKHKTRPDWDAVEVANMAD